jgi:hypothetical protein
MWHALIHRSWALYWPDFINLVTQNIYLHNDDKALVVNSFCSSKNPWRVLSKGHRWSLDGPAIPILGYVKQSVYSSWTWFIDSLFRWHPSGTSGTLFVLWEILKWKDEFKTLTFGPCVERLCIQGLSFASFA